MAAHGQLRTGAIMVASLLLALALYYGYLGSALVQPVAEWTAQWSGRGLGLLGTSTSVDGTVLWSDGLAFEIVAECTPVGPLALLVGAMLAYPAPWRSRLLGALIGAISLTTVNLLRIMSLFWVGSSYPEYLEVAHLLVWQTAIVLFAVIVWLLWVQRIAHDKNA